jgi:hypothetical protein
MNVQLELPENLKLDIEFIKNELKELKSKFTPKEPAQFVTRKYVMDEMLHCGITTLHKLSVKGVLTKYQCGGRILYKRDEVESAIVKLKL